MEGHDNSCNFCNIIVKGKALGSSIVVDAQARSPGGTSGTMFKAVIHGGAICPDVNSSRERGRDNTGGAGEVVPGVRGERVSSTRGRHSAHLVVLSEEGHGGREDPNAARGVAHGGPNVDGRGSRGTRMFMIGAPRGEGKLFLKGGNLPNAFLAVQATG